MIFAGFSILTILIGTLRKFLVLSNVFFSILSYFPIIRTVRVEIYDTGCLLTKYFGARN